MSNNQPQTTDPDEWALELLISIRGGLPEKCDFCGQPYTDGRYPAPEEAGEWACNECEARWGRAP